MDFLLPGASRHQLIEAAARNHCAWFTANAHASGGEVGETGGMPWIIASGQMTLAFPHVSAAKAGQAIDTLIADAHRRELKGASCWSLSPTRPRDLGARLAARGFEWGWRPHWMALELREDTTDLPHPEGLGIVLDDAGGWEVEDLPYYDRENDTTHRFLWQQTPRRTWRFSAWQDGNVVGHCTVYVTDGPHGIAGIYNVGVVPSARRRGIGKAVSLAACQFARKLGCRYALLNSAADFLYESIGFQSLGYGQTWWMHAPALASPHPTPMQVAFVEAVGRGDVAFLDTLPVEALPTDWDAPTLNGMTLMQMAVRAGKPASADWLAARGATLDILHLWDLGQKTRARRLLVEVPHWANRQMGPDQLTPLHDAVLRNDAALTRLLLSAHPDLSLQDARYHSTPLGWARHLGRDEITALLEKHQVVHS